jgi:hypothetical protein
MRNNFQEVARPLMLLCYLVLSACGGGNDATNPSRALQESELYNPVNHPAGVTEQPGQTAVLGLQANASDLPPLPNAPNKGVEDLWFEVKDAQPMQFALDADMQGPVDRVEIRDAGNTLLATLSAGAPVLTLALAEGQYQALVYAGAAATAPAPVFVQYGAAASAAQGAQLEGRVQAQAQYTITIKNTNVDPMKSYVIFQPSCSQCNLQGHSFSAWYMSGRDLHATSFNNANLSWTEFYQAKLQDTNFTSATLSNANFQGANLVGANFTGANLTGAQFTNADLSNAIWVDGVKRCAPGSVGVCR